MRRTGLASGRGTLAWLLVALGLAASERASAEEPAPEASYRILLEIDPQEGEISGVSEIALTNSSSLALDRIPLVLYPNRFRTIDRAIDDTNFERYYSFRFHPGDMTLSSAEADDGTPLAIETPATPAMPRGTYVTVALREPLPPGKTAHVRLRFQVNVPDRFGMFGRRDSRIITEGGAWPMIPARSRGGAFEPALGPMRASHSIVARTLSGDVV